MNPVEVLFHTNHFPHTKRLRGAMRRAERILFKAGQFDRQLGPEDEFYFCHWHRDWQGVGNYSREIRVITLKAHLQIFHILAQSALNMDKPFQLFLSLTHDDAGQDAVFMHTPNQYSEFPAVFSEGSWGLPELEKLLHELLPAYQFAACRQESNYVAFAIGIGTPLNGTTQEA